MSRHAAPILRGACLGVVSGAITDSWIAFLIVLVALVTAFEAESLTGGAS